MDLTTAFPAIAVRDHLIAPAAPESALPPQQSPSLQFFPPRFIEWNRLDLAFPAMAPGLSGLRIVHLTDLHFRRRWPLAYDAMFQILAGDPPDLLFITGDFVDSKRNHRPAMPNVRRFVEKCVARIGCFAIHGNHDTYAIGRELGDSPVMFLDGRRHSIQTPRGIIELIGLPGKRRAELEPAFVESIAPQGSGTLRIVLSHYPDHLKRLGRLQFDLFLAGHTHGGQICLPGGVPIIRHDALPRRLTTGAHRVGTKWLVVSRGLGATGLPVRLFCPPEVIEIRCQAGGAGVAEAASPGKKQTE